MHWLLVVVLTAPGNLRTPCVNGTWPAKLEDCGGGTCTALGGTACAMLLNSPSQHQDLTISPGPGGRTIIHGPVEFDGPVTQKGGGDKLLAQAVPVPEHVVEVERTVYQPIQTERLVERTDTRPLEVALLLGVSLCLFTAGVGFKLGGRVERYRHERDLPWRK